VLIGSIDTDHPVFQVSAPEYVEAHEDILAERIVARWKTVYDLTRAQAVSIVKEEYVRLQAEIDKRSGLALPSHDRGLSAVLAHISDSASPLLELDVVLYCYGLIGRAEESMEQIAKRHKLSKQAFSKRVDRLLADFHLPPQNGMRPVHQRHVYESVHVAKWGHIEQDAPAPKP
jgi:hypothetical protein